MAATRCKWCCGELQIDEEMQHVLELANKEIEEQENKQSWCMMFALPCCVRPSKADSSAAGKLVTPISTAMVTQAVSSKKALRVLSQQHGRADAPTGSVPASVPRSAMSYDPAVLLATDNGGSCAQPALSLKPL